MYIQQLTEIVPLPSQNSVAVCNQITILISYFISSGLVTILKVTDAPTHVSDILGPTVSFKPIIFSFQIFLLLFPKYLLHLHLTLFKLSIMLRFLIL